MKEEGPGDLAARTPTDQLLTTVHGATVWLP